MIRFVMRRVRFDEQTRLKSEDLFSIDGDVVQLELAIRSGGSSERGYDSVALLGIELIEDAS